MNSSIFDAKAAMGILYSNLKIFNYHEKIRSLPRNAAITPPLHIRLKPTNKCNHHCWYCAYRKEDMQLGQDMRIQDEIPEAKMREICDDLISMGVKAVTFSGGGEPLLYPHLLSTAKRLHEGGVRLASLTNGALLDGELSEFFAHSATWLRISMDGWDDGSYTRYRRAARGEYSRIMKNIAEFKKYGGPCVLSVNINIDADNWPHIRPMLERLKNAGVDNVKLAGCITDNDSAVVNAYHAPFFKECKEIIRQAAAELSDASFMVYDSYHEIENRFAKTYEWCPYQQILVIIGADCNVYSCQDKAYNFSRGLLGSIKERGFKEFWLDGKEKFFKIKPCADCNHHCVSNAKNKMLLEYLNLDPEHNPFV